MAIVAVMEDLIFRVKVQAAASHLGASLTLAPDASAAVQALRQASASLVVVDLNHATQDSVEIVRAVRRASPSVRIVGYCAHIDTDLRARAAAAGCTEVLPRSVFVQRLSELFT